MDLKLINLETANTTYQIGVDSKGFLFHLYYGAKMNGNAEPLLVPYFRGGNGTPYDYMDDRTFSCDLFPQEYSCYGSGDYRNHAFRIHTEDGTGACDLRYVRHTVNEGKYALAGLPASYANDGDRVQSVDVVLEDKRLGIEVTLKYGVFYDKDIITRAAVLTNKGTDNIYVNKMLSASFDFVTGEYDLIHFYGKHFNEMNMERRPVGHERISIGSRRGVSGHQHNACAVLCEHGANEECGGAYAFSVMYSGNFLIEAETDQYGQVRIGAGLSDEMLDYRLGAGEAFTAPEVIMTYSDDGFTRMSHNMQGFIRNNVCRGKFKNIRRPILVNNWEATYFDFTGDKLVEIAKEAANLGIEMFVLDDGWFGKRGPDDRGLGDWVVNEEKMGGPLTNVVNKINDLGLKFGIWFEPEMVNEDSDLYRAHPDWAITVPGKPPVLGRSQLMLDFTRKDVRDAIFDQVTAIIDSANIEYIKVDMNRSICEAYSHGASYQNFGEICYKYMLGVYDFFERLMDRYPELLIEGCSSGGARFDAGLMYYTPQIWTSDNTDAIERLNIQCGASFVYPVSTFGSHISAIPNHQNGRCTDIDTRAAVAMSGNFGYELDLTKLSEDDKAKIRKQIEVFKEDWNIIHNGLYYRVTGPLTAKDGYGAGEFVAWDMTTEDRKHALVTAVTTNTHGNPIPNYIKVRGLSDEAIYKCRETGKEWSGALLRKVGMPLPLDPGEYNAYRYHFDMV